MTKDVPDFVSPAIASYEQLRPTCELFAERLSTLIHTLLSDSSIDVHAIEARAKPVASFREKLLRPGKTYTDPLVDVPDLIGLRVIVYYLRDVPRVHDVLESHFRFLPQHSSNTIEEMQPDQFGYLSDHLVLSLKHPRIKLVEWKDFSQLHFEVQIRTVLQHAWAAISHSLQYKREEDVPLSLRRELFRLSALLETADANFETLRQRIEAIDTETAYSMKHGRGEIEINIHSIVAFLRESGVVGAALKDALMAGFSNRDDHQALGDDESASNLIALCSTARISTIAALDKFLLASKLWRAEYFRDLIAASKTEQNPSATWHTGRSFVVILLVMSACGKDMPAKRMISEFEYDESIANRIATFAAKYHKKALVSLTTANASLGEVVRRARA